MRPKVLQKQNSNISDTLALYLLKIAFANVFVHNHKGKSMANVSGKDDLLETYLNDNVFLPSIYFIAFG